MPNKDIEHYYLHEFQAIRAEPQYTRVQFPTPWPSSEDLACLVQKASSQFVYATTAVRSIQLTGSNPVTQLRRILEYTPENASPESSSFSALDELYHMILSLTPNHERLLSILAAALIIPPHASPSPNFIELLLDLPPGEVDLTLRSMHSVLKIGDGDTPIGVYHTSFIDFLYDPSRSQQFHISRVTRHDALACQWLRALTHQVQADPSIVLKGDPLLLAPNLRRLLEAWAHFCFQDNQPTKEVVEERDNFLQSVLSTFPDQQKLLTVLMQSILLPTEESQILHELGVLPGDPSTMNLLRACQLATSYSHGLKMKPFFVDFLFNPSQQYYIDLQKHQDYVARLWIQALVPKNLPVSR
ncbi:hypothetical protein AAF712_012433 [Marasmius tenuissimus]|uniref:Uncharacterized protein n=1 Tax=Marasmius tenuissimus TaxID=585030 RepID=A0ABR2ZHG4_9AGAR